MVTDKLNHSSENNLTSQNKFKFNDEKCNRNLIATRLE